MDLFVISDIRLYRDGLSRLLDGFNGICVTGAAADVGAAAAAISAMPAMPDVAVVDVARPDGMAALRTLGVAVPGVKILAITVPDRASDVVACAQSGAVGFVTRDASMEELLEGLRGVMEGEVRCSPRMTAALLEHVGSLAREVDPQPGALTPREREILELIECGMSNKQIAQRLAIGLPTVKNHVHRILDKLGVANRTQAVTRSREGLTSGPRTGVLVQMD